MATTSKNTKGLSMEGRLAALEARLGVSSNKKTNTGNTIIGNNNGNNNGSHHHYHQNADMASRLDAVQSTMNKYTTPQFRSLTNETRALLQELDPGQGLTHQQQPLLYKRQEVLAASSQLEQDMGELSKLLPLLLLGQKQPPPPQAFSTAAAAATSGGSGTTRSTNRNSHTHGNSNITMTTAAPLLLREEQVTQAPILTDMAVSPEDQRRLDALRVTVEDLNGRTQRLASTLDNLLETYHLVLSAASEKCILAHEAISDKEKGRPKPTLG